jgi:hypothetical protein
MKLILSLLLTAAVNAGTYTETIELGNAKNFVILAKSGISAAPDSTADPKRINLKGGSIGGETLTPFVYTFTTAMNINSDIILRGESDDVFIINSYRSDSVRDPDQAQEPW